MLENTTEQWQIMQHSFAPLRLTRWQLTKMFAAQINRDHPIAAKLIPVLAVVFTLWLVSVLTRPRKLEKVFGLPAVGGSGSRQNDFFEIIKEGKRKVTKCPG